MAIEKGLYSLLAGTAGVTSLISTRIYPNHAAQNAGSRYVVYQRVTTEVRRHLKGASNLKRATIQVDSYGSTYSEAKELGDAVRAAISENGYSGTWDNQTVLLAFWDDDSDGYVGPQVNDDGGKHFVSMDLVVWYRPS